MAISGSWQRDVEVMEGSYMYALQRMILCPDTSFFCYRCLIIVADWLG